MKTLRLLLVILTVLIVTFAVGAMTGTTAGRQLVPAGMQRNSARYIVMRDSVKIAIDLWLPSNLAGGATVPTIVNATRYVRAMQAGPLTHWLRRFRRGSEADRTVEAFNAAGYAVVLVDARGSGASSGTREMEWSPEEVEDYGQVVDWIVAQGWSNGRVGAQGVSYEGNTAELLAATGRSAIKAVAPLFDDFDPSVNIAFMGGVLNEDFVRQWGTMNGALDRNDLCTLAGLTGFKCRALPLVMTGIKPVDDDVDGSQLAQLLASRKNYDVLAALQQLRSPRDTVPGSTSTLVSVSPSGLRSKLEQFNTPMLIRVGWLDGGTTNVALSRFFTHSNPQQLEIGPWSHGGGHHVDQFLPSDTQTTPSSAQQLQQMIAFFDRYLKSNDNAAPAVHEIRYYTMNDGRWRTTKQWPPAGMEVVRWYFSDSGVLSREIPSAALATDRYAVDTMASTGNTNTRWHTQLGGGDVIYGNRALADQRLLTYTSAPFASDVEISGVPVVTLNMASTHTDGGFFGYLEDVAPDGTVTYITEGMLRALHRKISAAPPPYRMFGPHHTYTSTDTTPLTVGVVESIQFELFATSVRIAKGHRLRLALAGADRPNLALYPAGSSPTWTVHRSAATSSFVEVQMANATPR
jgi:uncharacterized protein